MIIDTPKKLPSRNLLPLATTVERVYSEAPTWLVAVGLGILMAALVAVGNWRETQAADQECAALYGATNARCAQ